MLKDTERPALLVWVALWWRYPRGMQRVLKVGRTGLNAHQQLANLTSLTGLWYCVTSQTQRKSSKGAGPCVQLLCVHSGSVTK
jgi:hypothetical protein